MGNRLHTKSWRNSKTVIDTYFISVAGAFFILKPIAFGIFFQKDRGLFFFFKALITNVARNTGLVIIRSTNLDKLYASSIGLVH